MSRFRAIGSRAAARRVRIAALLVVTSALMTLGASMFAVEITRAFTARTAEPPLPLPEGVDIRYSDRLVALIGRGTPGGRAAAVTLGSVILVPERFDELSAEARRNLIRHELVHVEQHVRYGRLYLPLYGLLYVIHGYEDHPFEREVRRRRGTQRTTGDALRPVRDTSASAALPAAA